MKGCIIKRPTFFICFFLINQLVFGKINDWQYQVPIKIYENSGALLQDFQVMLTIDTQTPISGGNMKLNGSDIRFALGCEDTIFLHYWIDSWLNTDTTKIWVKVPNIPASDTTIIYLLYGNTSALAMSNADSTFDLYDDFDSTITEFSSKCGFVIPSLTDSSVKLNWANNGLYGSNKTFPDSIAFMAEANIIRCSGRWPGLYWKISTIGPGYSVLTDSSGPDVRIGKRTGSAGLCGGESWASNAFVYSNPAGIWQHTWIETGNIVSYFPQVGQITSADTQHVKSGELFLLVGGIPGGVGSIELDWIRVRKYASIEPTYLIGHEQGLLVAAFTYNSSGKECAFSNNSINATSYLWDFGDGNLNTIANPTHIYNTFGAYYVCLIASNYCNSDTICDSVFVFENGISEYHPNYIIKAFPNPLNTNVEIQIYPPLQDKRSEITLTLFNFLGEEIYKLLNYSGRFTLQRNSMPSGIYFFQLRTKKEILGIGKLIAN